MARAARASRRRPGGGPSRATAHTSIAAPTPRGGGSGGMRREFEPILRQGWRRPAWYLPWRTPEWVTGNEEGQETANEHREAQSGV